MPSNTPSDPFASEKNMIANGLYEKAVVSLYPIVKQQPALFQGWLLLSRCLYHVGHKSEAVNILQHAERYDPLQRDFHRIQQYMQANDYDGAYSAATHMLKVEEHHPRAYFTQASVLLRTNRPEQAAQVVSDALCHLPANVALRQLLVTSLATMGTYHDALSESLLLTELNPSFGSLWAHAGLLLKYGQYDALLAACERCLPFVSEDPRHISDVLLMKGQALRIVGQREASIKTLQSAIQANPHNADAWWALADFKNYTFTSEELAQLTQLSQASSLPRKSRAIGTFALAKACEQNDGLAAAMRSYQAANQLINPGATLIQHMAQEFSSRKRAFNKDNLRIQACNDETFPTPIFIVGLPRSGSTLVEQILASHSNITGTIEQPTLPHVEQAIQRYCEDNYKMNAFDALSVLSQEELTRFGQRYLREGALFRAKSTPYFIDKQPFNYRMIGWIHKLLPNAKIIDVRRHPLDCGVSLYKQFFHSGVDFSYCWKNIGDAYREYVHLMAHWHKELPSKVLQLDYEALVAAPEQQIRRLLQYIGVEFEPACLAFHTANRPVHTASSEQVRQPLHANALGGWRQVEPWLDELKQRLGDLV